MSFYVYAIKSQHENYIYVGLTSNINRRFAQHNSGHEKTTKFYAPFTLLYNEQCKTRPEARIREKYLKSGAGKEFLKTLL